jgi:hypothetical protein
LSNAEDYDFTSFSIKDRAWRVGDRNDGENQNGRYIPIIDSPVCLRKGSLSQVGDVWSFRDPKIVNF